MATVDNAQATRATLTLASFTVGSGTNRVLYVFVGHTTGATISGCTYNGVALTQIASQTTAGGVNKRVHLFRLIAPASGTADVVVSASSSSNAAIAAVSLEDVDPVTPDGTAAGSSGTGTSSSIAVASVAADLVMDCLVDRQIDYSDLGVGAGQTVLVDTPVDSSVTINVSTEVATGASTTMSWTWVDSDTFAHLGIAVKTATGPGAVTITPPGGALGLVGATTVPVIASTASIPLQSGAFRGGFV